MENRYLAKALREVHNDKDSQMDIILPDRMIGEKKTGILSRIAFKSHIGRKISNIKDSAPMLPLRVTASDYRKSGKDLNDLAKIPLERKSQQTTVFIRNLPTTHTTSRQVRNLLPSELQSTNIRVQFLSLLD